MKTKDIIRLAWPNSESAFLSTCHITVGDERSLNSRRCGYAIFPDFAVLLVPRCGLLTTMLQAKLSLRSMTTGLMIQAHQTVRGLS